MKKIFLFLIFVSQSLLAQTPYTSLVGKYDRDKKSSFDATDYPKDFMPCTLANGKTSETIISSITFRGYDENQNYAGVGEVSYYFKNVNGQCPSGGKSNLTKPIIVLDGFDPLDVRSGAKIYGKYLRYDRTVNGSLVRSFLGDKLREVGTGFDVVILNFPQYQRGGNVSQIYNCPVPPGYVPQPGQPTRDQLCTQLGYPGGTKTVTTFYPEQQMDGGSDYIERNAMVLVELIQKTNQTLIANGSTEKITIVGPSMGGLISRYALAYMEKNNLPHNCKLWISFDAPHLGANIPIGDQWWVDFIATRSNAESAVEANEKRLGSIAARQMLLFHKLSGSEGIPTPAIKDGINYRDRFITNLESNGLANSLGFPTLPRKTCLINGAINGTLQKVINSGVEQSRDINACEKAFTCEIKLSKSTRTLALLTCFFGFLPGCAAAAPITISTTKVYFQPSYGTNCQVFVGTFPINKGDKRNAGSLANSISLDIAPGGYYTTQDDLSSGQKNDGFFANWVGAISNFPDTQVKFYSVIDNHSFIPTKSSLGYRWNNKSTIGDFAENLSTKSLVCSRDIPFDTYYAPDKNEEHVFLTEASANFAINEIKGIMQNPIDRNVNITITGQLDCKNANSTITASIPVQEAGTQYNWQLTAGLQIVSGSGTNQITIKSNGARNPSESISLSAITSCSNIQPSAVTLPRIGGYSSDDYPVTGPDNAVCNGFVTYSTVNLPGATNYNWIYPTWATNVTGQGTRTLSFYIPASVSYTSMTVGVRVANACDAGGSPAFKTATISCLGGRAFAIYPNPASNEFSVEPVSVNAISSTSSNKKVEPFEIKLYDSFNQLVSSGTSIDGKSKINTIQLRDGLYILHILKSGQLIESQHISILH